MGWLDWLLPVILGVGCGVVATIGLRVEVLPRLSQDWRCGYLIASASGVLVGASFPVISNGIGMLESQTTAIGHAVENLRWIPDALVTSLSAGSFPLLLGRGVWIGVVIFAYMRASRELRRPKENGRAHSAQPWASRSVGAITYGTFASISLGLFAYGIGLGQSRSVYLYLGQRNQFVAVLSQVLLAALLVIPVGFSVDQNSHRTAFAALVPAMAGLGVALGLGTPSVLSIPWLQIGAALTATITLVTGIGRLINAAEYQIGLGWRTTLAVAIGAATHTVGQMLSAQLILEL